MRMLNGLPRVKTLVFGMFGEWSQGVVQLLKLAAGNLAARWAALNGLSAEDALKPCTWDHRGCTQRAVRYHARRELRPDFHARSPTPSRAPFETPPGAK